MNYSKWILSLFLIFSMLAITAIIVWSDHLSDPTSELQASQIQSLRQTYPTYTDTWTTGERKQQFLADIARNASSYVIAEVMTTPTDRIVVLDSGFTDEMEKEMIAKGVNPGSFEVSMTWRDYTLAIQDVIFSGNTLFSGDFTVLPGLEVHKGDRIVVSDSNTFMDRLPLDLQQGMRIIIPIFSADSDGLPYEHSTSLIGLYYIVENDYILSVYNEPEEYTFSGITVDRFEEVILNMRK